MCLPKRKTVMENVAILLQLCHIFGTNTQGQDHIYFTAVLSNLQKNAQMGGSRVFLKTQWDQ